MSLSAVGNNKFFQLGILSDSMSQNGDRIVSKFSRIQVDAINIRCISPGMDHTVIVTKDGSVLSAGIGDSLLNENENFGFEEITVCNEPIIWAAASHGFTLYITESGKVINNNLSHPHESMKINLNKKAVSVFAGEQSILNQEKPKCAIIDEEGKLYIFSYDYRPITPKAYKLPSPVIDVACCHSFCAILLSDGSVYLSKKNFYLHLEELTFVEFLRGHRIVKISGKCDTCLALSDGGVVFSYGSNSYGQLGDGTTEDNFSSFQEIKSLSGIFIKDIACSYHSLFLTYNGEIYGCGCNEDGQLNQKYGPNIFFPFEFTKSSREITSIFAGERNTFILNDVNIENSSHVFIVNNVKSQDSLPIDQNKTDVQAINLLKRENQTLKEEVESLKKKLSVQNIKKKQKSNEFKIIYDLTVDPSDFNEIMKIGRGRSGEVWLVKHCESGEELAMKKYICYEFSEENEEEQKRFVREIEIGANADHPCVIKYLGCFLPTPNSNPTLFFEYARKGNLQVLINKRDPILNSTRKALCVLEICSGMRYLHSINIIHRDLKPSNILVTDRMHFKISDFSDSKMMSEDFSLTGDRGTKFYQSPEIINESEYDFKTDVFSFGVILFVLVTGTLPRVKPIDFLQGKRADIPQGVTPFARDLITSCWSQDPQARPSFAEIIEILRTNDFMIFPDVDSLFILERYEQLIDISINDIKQNQSLQEEKQKIEIENQRLTCIIKNMEIEIGKIRKQNDLLHTENQKIKDENESLKIQQKEENTHLKEEIESLKKKLQFQESQKSKQSKKVRKFDELIVNPNEINDIRSIRRGASGDFRLVKHCESGEELIKKQYHYEFSHNEDEKKKFVREIEIWANADHPCVIKFFGCYLPTPNSNPTLFFEYAGNGNLDTLIANKKTWFDSTRKALCVLEICAGMRYLHSINIVYRDLRPSNILITDRMHFKINLKSLVNVSAYKYMEDFLYKKDQLIYFAHELIDGDEYDFKTDVFAFGVILFVLVTGNVPKLTMNQIRCGDVADIPPSVTPFVMDLILMCWSYYPQDRPSFDEIIKFLRTNDFMIFPDVDPLFLGRYDQIINN